MHSVMQCAVYDSVFVRDGCLYQISVICVPYTVMNKFSIADTYFAFICIICEAHLSIDISRLPVLKLGPNYEWTSS